MKNWNQPRPVPEKACCSAVKSFKKSPYSLKSYRVKQTKIAIDNVWLVLYSDIDGGKLVSPDKGSKPLVLFESGIEI